MAKAAPDAMIDASLNYVAAGNKLTLCAGAPTTYTQANSTNRLGEVTLDAGDFTVANGTTSGRKVTIGAQAGVPITVSGTVDHVAIVSTGDSTLRYVTTVSSQALTSGNTADVGAWAIEIADPT